MAASLQRIVVGLNFSRYSKFWASFVRKKSSAHVVMTDDSSTIVCWHPEPRFPYEKSLPIPEKKVMPKSNSLLKVQSIKEFLSTLKPKREEVVIDELMRLTATAKYCWYPEKQRFRKKPRPEPDRPYL